jgi:hypothetical protein
MRSGNQVGWLLHHREKRRALGAMRRPSWKSETSANIAAEHPGNAGETPLRTRRSRERGHLARNGRPARSLPIPSVSHDNHFPT